MASSASFSALAAIAIVSPALLPDLFSATFWILSCLKGAFGLAGSSDLAGSSGLAGASSYGE